MRGKKRKRKWVLLLILFGVIWLVHEGRFWIPSRITPPEGYEPVVVEMKTTSYCHCRKCCSYKWMLFVPYQKRGAFNFRIKHVGKTSSGAMVRPGTLAADTSIYPYGTVMHIPGYGYGRVEDTGGAIKGRHIDLYRPNHWWARQWGVRTKKVTVWLPPRPQPWFIDPQDLRAAEAGTAEQVTAATNSVQAVPEAEGIMTNAIEAPAEISDAANTNFLINTSSEQNPLP